MSVIKTTDGSLKNWIIAAMFSVIVTLVGVLYNNVNSKLNSIIATNTDVKKDYDTYNNRLVRVEDLVTSNKQLIDQVTSTMGKNVDYLMAKDRLNGTNFYNKHYNEQHYGSPTNQIPSKNSAKYSQEMDMWYNLSYVDSLSHLFAQSE